MALLTSLDDEAGNAIASALIADFYDEHGARGLAALVMATRGVAGVILEMAAELGDVTKAELVAEVGLAFEADST